MAEFRLLEVREMTCTPRELARWVGVMENLFELTEKTNSYALFTLKPGTGKISWKEMPQLAIGLVRLNRMEVRLEASQDAPAESAERFRFEFDRRTLRGGG